MTMEFAHAIPTDDGRWVNADYERLARVIKDYDEEMELAWIPPEQRAFHDAPPYAIIHRPKDGKTYVVFTITEAEMNPELVLARLFRGDLRKNPNVLEQMDAQNAAAKALKLKEQMDAAEERQDLVASIVGSHKHSFKHNGRVFRK